MGHNSWNGGVVAWDYDALGQLMNSQIIGEDASRARRSEPYQMETSTLQRNNYPVTKDPQPPSQP